MSRPINPVKRKAVAYMLMPEAREAVKEMAHIYQRSQSRIVEDLIAAKLMPVLKAKRVALQKERRLEAARDKRMNSVDDQFEDEELDMDIL